ncbi:MAG: DNA recombination protein RmuC [Anaerolineales bacterium]|nr:MAG: DNA recombination protein RmuC [Anaerolineales bacterium]
MITITEVLLAVVIVLLLVLLYLVLQRGRVEPKDIESAISSVWKESGLDEKIGRLATYAQDIRDDYRSLEQMLRVPVERASLGEIALEQILSDQLPPDMFGIRERILDRKVPDAHIKSTVGAICIDSKFPLDNYRKMVEAEDSKEKGKFQKQFIRDVRGHLDKIADDYVCPEKGSAEFAFAFIPSESVYYFLVTEAYDTLRSYTSRGVQAVSPLTLSHKIELIKAGVHARKLSEQAEKIRNDIARLSQRFSEVDNSWQIFYETHLRNAEKKAEELDGAYKRLRDEFDKISQLSGD